jgi:sugar lactone lactonase YvrE
MSDVQVLADGIAFGESPRWHEHRLWFSDWGAQEVVALDLEGRSEVVLRVQSFPFCIDFLPDGRLLVVSARDRLLLRRESDGSLVTHADLSTLSGKPWNDIVVDGRGNAYVNNIGFDFARGEFAPGIVALVSPEGESRRVADGLAFPNGMAVTPDNSTLIVAESYGSMLTAFEITSDGSLSNRRTWADTPGDHPDGICLDAEGAVWYGDVGNKWCVRVAEGGEVLQKVELDRGCFACALGGEEGRTLIMVAQEWGGTARVGEGARTGQIVTTQAPAAGAGWP